jgi:hypothetical protein
VSEGCFKALSGRGCRRGWGGSVALDLHQEVFQRVPGVRLDHVFQLDADLIAPRRVRLRQNVLELDLAGGDVDGFPGGDVAALTGFVERRGWFGEFDADLWAAVAAEVGAAVEGEVEDFPGDVLAFGGAPADERSDWRFDGFPITQCLFPWVVFCTCSPVPGCLVVESFSSV